MMNRKKFGWVALAIAMGCSSTLDINWANSGAAGGGGSPSGGGAGNQGSSATTEECALRTIDDCASDGECRVKLLRTIDVGRP